jgi:hypothetical protein
MGVGLHRPEIVHGHDVDVLATRFVDSPDDVPADAAKSVDGDFYGHRYFLQELLRGGTPVIVRTPPARPARSDRAQGPRTRRFIAPARQRIQPQPHLDRWIQPCCRARAVVSGR